MRWEFKISANELLEICFCYNDTAKKKSIFISIATYYI